MCQNCLRARKPSSLLSGGNKALCAASQEGLRVAQHFSLGESRAWKRQLGVARGQGEGEQPWGHKVKAAWAVDLSLHSVLFFSYLNSKMHHFVLKIITLLCTGKHAIKGCKKL